MEINRARIDKQGILSMMRGGEWKQQHCAKRHDHLCGDLCALFQVVNGIEEGEKALMLCTGTCIIMDIEDLRSAEPDQPDLIGVDGSDGVTS